MLEIQLRGRSPVLWRRSRPVQRRVCIKYTSSRAGYSGSLRISCDRASGNQRSFLGGENEMDYFRQALDGCLPHGIWPKLERIVGFARPHLVRHLHILNLSDELLYLSSLDRVEERRLRVIVAAPQPCNSSSF
jgi:hypothetical protein